MIRLIPQGKQIHLTERIFPYHETDEKANVMSFLIILAPSLDLLSILLKTDSNKIVFFAATFVRYEKIYTGYIYYYTDNCKCFSIRTVPYGYQRHYFRTEQKGTAQTKGGSQKFPLQHIGWPKLYTRLRCADRRKRPDDLPYESRRHHTTAFGAADVHSLYVQGRRQPDGETATLL